MRLPCPDKACNSKRKQAIPYLFRAKIYHLIARFLPIWPSINSYCGPFQSGYHNFDCPMMELMTASLAKLNVHNVISALDRHRSFLSTSIFWLLSACLQLSVLCLASLASSFSMNTKLQKICLQQTVIISVPFTIIHSNLYSHNIYINKYQILLFAR